MKIVFAVFSIVSILFARSTIYEDCSKPEHLRQKLSTEERIKRDQPYMPTKEEREEENKLEKSLYDILVIETNTSKTLIIKNKSYCDIEFNEEWFKKDELKDFQGPIAIKAKQEVKITKMK